MAEVHAESKLSEAAPSLEIHQENIEKVWIDYLTKVEQETTRNILRGIPLNWSDPILSQE